MAVRLSKANRLAVIIGISFSFFCAEIAVGFYTSSLALVADAFHYLNDLIGFIVAFVAFKISERTTAPKELSFGWQRANLLGAFFNGVFLLALGVSIFLQSIERFISIEGTFLRFLQQGSSFIFKIEVQNPRLVLIIGGVGLVLNIISALILHEHDENVRAVIDGTEGETEMQSRSIVNPHRDHHHEASPPANATKREHDAGLMGVLIHVMGDAVNNVGVIIAAAIMWKTTSPGRFYADPAISMAISLMIFFSSWPLVIKTGTILLESVPKGVSIEDVQQDLEKIPGVLSIHELHIWRLNQQKSLASAHMVVSDIPLHRFMELARTVSECFHAYGIHYATLQPELPSTTADETGPSSSDVQGLRHRMVGNTVCYMNCENEICHP